MDTVETNGLDSVLSGVRVHSRDAQLLSEVHGRELVALGELEQALAELLAARRTLVAMCREAGHTWAQIALVLGTSTQAAHQTYSGRYMRVLQGGVDTIALWDDTSIPVEP